MTMGEVSVAMATAVPYQESETPLKTAFVMAASPKRLKPTNWIAPPTVARAPSYDKNSQSQFGDGDNGFLILINPIAGRSHQFRNPSRNLLSRWPERTPHRKGQSINHLSDDCKGITQSLGISSLFGR